MRKNENKDVCNVYRVSSALQDYERLYTATQASDESNNGKITNRLMWVENLISHILAFTSLNWIRYSFCCFFIIIHYDVIDCEWFRSRLWDFNYIAKMLWKNRIKMTLSRGTYTCIGVEFHIASLGDNGFPFAAGNFCV